MQVLDQVFEGAEHVCIVQADGGCVHSGEFGCYEVHMPESIGWISVTDGEGLVVFDKFDIFTGEDSSVSIITELSNRKEWVSFYAWEHMRTLS